MKPLPLFYKSKTPVREKDPTMGGPAKTCAPCPGKAQQTKRRRQWPKTILYPSPEAGAWRGIKRCALKT